MTDMDAPALAAAAKKHAYEYACEHSETRSTATLQEGIETAFLAGAELLQERMRQLRAELSAAGERIASGHIVSAGPSDKGGFQLTLKPAKEIVEALCAGMAEMVNDANYVECEMGPYTVTIQHRQRPTPHEKRKQAEEKVASLESDLASKELELSHIGQYNLHNQRMAARAEEERDQARQAAESWKATCKGALETEQALSRERQASLVMRKALEAYASIPERASDGGINRVGERARDSLVILERLLSAKAKA